MPQTLILPYTRVSPIHIPRRDLVLSAADSLTLRVTVVESDDPSAQALYLTGGIGGPSIRLLIWHDGGSRQWWNSGCCCDYGAPLGPQRVLFTGVGTIAADAAGSFDINIPSGALAQFPRRCGWAISLDFNGSESELLAQGVLQVVGSWGAAQFDQESLLTDAGDLVLEDDGVTPVDAA